MRWGVREEAPSAGEKLGGPLSRRGSTDTPSENIVEACPVRAYHGRRRAARFRLELSGGGESARGSSGAGQEAAAGGRAPLLMGLALVNKTDVTRQVIYQLEDGEVTWEGTKVGI